MGTLYVVGAPEGSPDDITLRAKRILGQVALIIAGDMAQARHLLACHGITTPLADVVCADAFLDALRVADVALLHADPSPGPTGAAYQRIQAAIDGGFPVVPIPGSSLVVTALVISGLPADSFLSLGELPPQPVARRELLALVAGEPRTLVALEWPARLPETLADLQETLGQRPLVVVAAFCQGIEVAWRGAVGEAPGFLLERPCQGPCALVLGGTGEKTVCWEKDRLLAEVQARLAQGLGAKEISQQLAAQSGWPRREIYRLATQEAGFSYADKLW